MKLLLINACVREQSRTLRLARHLLSKFQGQIDEVDLACEKILPLDGAGLALRDRLLAEGKTDDPMFGFARQFASADVIVIAAPYWDLSFPSMLKVYMEAVCVCGVTFIYEEDGRPRGLCRAGKAYYVTTAGGPVMDDAFGYGYIRAVLGGLLGIPEVRQFKAEGLDIIGADVEGILEKTRAEIDEVMG